MTELWHCGEGALIVLWAGTAITAAVFGLMVYSIVRFCRSRHPSSVPFVPRAAVEVVWAVIPILILIVTAAPAVTTLVSINHNCSAVAAELRQN